jgi:hypothetical protein
MRGKRAKQLRKIIYGDESQRNERVYSIKETKKHELIKGQIREVTLRTLVNHKDHPRAKFLNLKKLYMRLKREGKMWNGRFV